LFVSLDVYASNSIITPEDSIYPDLSNNVSRGIVISTKKNLFDYLFVQSNNVDFYLHTGTRRRFTFLKDFYELGYKERFYNLFKTYFKVHPDIENKVKTVTKDFFGNTLGVHIRLTDLSSIHKGLGKFEFSDYVFNIKRLVKEFKIDTLFVASDNHVSLEKLRKIYPNILFYHDFIRHNKEIDRVNHTESRNSKNVYFHIQSFIESYTLSKCDVLLGRASGLFFGSTIWGNPKAWYQICN